MAVGRSAGDLRCGEKRLSLVPMGCCAAGALGLLKRGFDAMRTSANWPILWGNAEKYNEVTVDILTKLLTTLSLEVAVWRGGELRCITRVKVSSAAHRNAATIQS